MDNQAYVRLMTEDIVVQEKMLAVMGKYGDNRWWLSEDLKNMSYNQLFEDTLLIEFEVFHKGIEEVLGRGVQTIEFSAEKIEDLRAEAIQKAAEA